MGGVTRFQWRIWKIFLPDSVWYEHRTFKAN